METADRGALGAALQLACRRCLLEAGRPADPMGEPVELDELCTLVEALRRSTLWQRARRADRLLLETGLSVALPRPLLSGPGIDGDDVHAPLRVEGVVDLAFAEAGGWVIAGFEADRFGSAAQRLTRTLAYRRKMELLAAAWQYEARGPVAQKTILFTADGSEICW